jgi:hypothetical protein
LTQLGQDQQDWLGGNGRKNLTAKNAESANEGNGSEFSGEGAVQPELKEGVQAGNGGHLQGAPELRESKPPFRVGAEVTRL